MATNNFLTVCPSGCDDVLNLPALDTVQDCTKVDLSYSQVQDIVFLPSGATGPTDWTSASDWATVIDNTNADNTKAKVLTVEGGIDAPEKTEVDLPKRKKKTVGRLYTLQGTVKVLTDNKYTYLRALQCGDTSFTFWYTNQDHLFGGQNGITPESVDVDFIYSADKDAYEEAIVTITYDADGDPLRTSNVLP